MAEPQRYDSEPERISSHIGNAFMWRVTSALITEDVKDLGTIRQFSTGVYLPGSLELTEDEAEALTSAMHQKIIDTLLEMGKL